MKLILAFMNINATWMNSLKDEGIMKWLNAIMSDWAIAQCWKFKWKSTHHTESVWIFLWSVFTLIVYLLYVKARRHRALEDIFRECFGACGSGFVIDRLQIQSETTQSTDLAYGCLLGCEKYLPGSTVWEVQWYQLETLGTESSLFIWETQEKNDMVMFVQLRVMERKPLIWSLSEGTRGCWQGTPRFCWGSSTLRSSELTACLI